MTPSEALNFDNDDALCSIPPFTEKKAPNFPASQSVIATPAEAREFKQRGITLRPERFKKRMDNMRAAVLFRTTRKEAKWVAHLHKQAEDWARELGGATISDGVAPSRPEDKKDPRFRSSSSTVEGV